ncbi:glycosyltransferase [Fervidobacterium thailandense]|uniref:Glycosyl transferase group 1 n=1 Tax=Fervidobacterium thailandense TaxID=1008305 RepID=A0A1E3G4U5_9BACT|nr:glycosyltransferase [Fervidobacterium thailandense]ODN31202.1 glycosyl transferase group 1 [Fervidobacterium thailandense]
MRLLFVTNFFPYKSNPSRGIFVVRRLIEYKKLGVSYRVYGLAFRESPLLLALKRLLKKSPLVPLEDFQGIEFEYVYTRRGLSEVLSHKRGNTTFVERWARQVAGEILSSVGEDFDVILAHGMYLPVPAGLVALHLHRMTGKDYFVFLHGSDVNYQMRHPRLLGTYLNVLENARRALFVSNALKEQATRLGYSGQNAAVVPNGYDPEIFHPIDKVEIRKKLGIFRDGWKYVGFVGNLKEVKGADRLPEIFRFILRELPNTLFIIVGDGTLRKRLEEQLGDVDVIFTGNIPQTDVALYMNAMDVMVLPSRNEGWPCVILEAQACGTTVVGSDKGGIPEAVGFPEYVVEDGPDFKKRFAQRVVKFLSEGYDGKMLIQRAKNFTWESIVKSELELITNSR